MISTPQQIEILLNQWSLAGNDTSAGELVERLSRTAKWRAPETGFVKINVYEAFICDTERSGIGVIM